MSKMWDIFFKAQQNKILGEGQEKKKISSQTHTKLSKKSGGQSGSCTEHRFVKDRKVV